MANTAWSFKDPDEVLDYGILWTGPPDRLGSDTILTSIWIQDPPTGLVIDSDSHTLTTTIVWLSGGVEGVTYALTNRITTAGGRTMDQTKELDIASK